MHALLEQRAGEFGMAAPLWGDACFILVRFAAGRPGPFLAVDKDCLA
jgi:hypothetical protein